MCEILFNDYGCYVTPTQPMIMMLMTMAAVLRTTTMRKIAGHDAFLSYKASSPRPEVDYYMNGFLFFRFVSFFLLLSYKSKDFSFSVWKWGTRRFLLLFFYRLENRKSSVTCLKLHTFHVCLGISYFGRTNLRREPTIMQIKTIKCCIFPMTPRPSDS